MTCDGSKHEPAIWPDMQKSHRKGWKRSCSLFRVIRPSRSVIVDVVAMYSVRATFSSINYDSNWYLDTHLSENRWLWLLTLFVNTADKARGNHKRSSCSINWFFRDNPQSLEPTKITSHSHFHVMKNFWFNRVRTFRRMKIEFVCHLSRANVFPADYSD